MTLLIALLVGLAFALGAGTTPVWAQTQAPPAAKKAPVDINSASAAELKAVKGIGEADRLIRSRGCQRRASVTPLLPLRHARVHGSVNQK